MKIGKRIKEIRAFFQITSKEFAEKLEIPLRTVGSYERDEAQPGPKFFEALIRHYNVNINWLLSGTGNMFISSKTKSDLGFIVSLQERLSLTDEELNGLIDILDSEACREMLFKFIEIKKGNKEALNTLIYNLQGIKAIYGN
jgi:transcriptional regulator with XRE-family HTH domain